MRPDWRHRTAFRPAAPQHAGLRTSHVDYLLDFVIARSSTTAAGILVRLDALERTLTMLTRQWRRDEPLAPAREVRMSSETLAHLLEWLEAGGATERASLERLGVYASGAVADQSVPHGWIRLRVVE